MNNFICVLRSGGEFKVEHVTRLYDLCNKNMHEKFEFYCFTDVDQDQFPPCVKVIPLIHNWAGWWSKLEMFRDVGIIGPKFYMDLDTTPVDNLDTFFDIKENIVFLRDIALENNDKYNLSNLATGLIYWNTDLTVLYINCQEYLDSRNIKFESWDNTKLDFQPYRLLRNYALWDQCYITEMVKKYNIDWCFFSDVAGNCICSYKSILPSKVIPEGTTIIYYFGIYRPWKVDESYVERYRSKLNGS